MMHWNPPRWVPLTIFFFQSFFQTKNFFSGTKNFFSRNNFCSVFYVLKSKKKFWSDLLFLFLKIYLVFFEKQKIFKNFLIAPKFFFCFPIHKKLNKSCSLDKIFLFLKKKVVSLKKTSFSFFSKGHPYSIFILVF